MSWYSPDLSLCFQLENNASFEPSDDDLRYSQDKRAPVDQGTIINTNWLDRSMLPRGRKRPPGGAKDLPDRGSRSRRKMRRISSVVNNLFIATKSHILSLSLWLFLQTKVWDCDYFYRNNLSNLCDCDCYKRNATQMIDCSTQHFNLKKEMMIHIGQLIMPDQCSL